MKFEQFREEAPHRLGVSDRCVMARLRVLGLVDEAVSKRAAASRRYWMQKDRNRVIMSDYGFVRSSASKKAQRSSQKAPTEPSLLRRSQLAADAYARQLLGED